MTIDDRLPAGGTTKLEGRVGRAPKEIGGSAPPPNIGAQDDFPARWVGGNTTQKTIDDEDLPFPKPRFWT